MATSKSGKLLAVIVTLAIAICIGIAINKYKANSEREYIKSLEKQNANATKLSHGHGAENKQKANAFKIPSGN